MPTYVTFVHRPKIWCRGFVGSWKLGLLSSANNTSLTHHPHTNRHRIYIPIYLFNLFVRIVNNYERWGVVVVIDVWFVITVSVPDFNMVNWNVRTRTHHERLGGGTHHLVLSCCDESRHDPCFPVQKNLLNIPRSRAISLAMECFVMQHKVTPILVLPSIFHCERIYPTFLARSECLLIGTRPATKSSSFDFQLAGIVCLREFS
ncbi:hypothetical protein EDB19DRAFT_676789 [Suillus lakei]|nr:hypothetical protein EDB19DRAFT_676789 [Suillus lakei]